MIFIHFILWTILLFLSILFSIIFNQSLHYFIQSLHYFIQSLHYFIQCLLYFIQSLHYFTQTLHDFIQSFPYFILCYPFNHSYSFSVQLFLPIIHLCIRSFLNPIVLNKFNENLKKHKNVKSRKGKMFKENLKS